MDDMVDAMKQEMAHRMGQVDSWQTVYFGGGTPSVLNARQIQSLIDTATSHAPLQSGAEVTLEANPEDVNDRSIDHWIQAGVNRISLGVQSFEDRQLQWMNRAHNASQAVDAIKRLQDAGLSHITMDLIYGLPETSLAYWQDQVGQALAMDIPHLSTYGLTVEDKTVLHADIASGKISKPMDERSVEDFMWHRSHLREQGWLTYELSNSCQPGFEASHNAAYWRGDAYVGIGSGAHSFDGQWERRLNVANNPMYIKAMKAGDSSGFELETLGPIERRNEQLMTGLRTDLGFQRSHAGKWAETLDHLWSDAIAKGHMLRLEDRWKLTDAGMMWSDAIAAAGFITDNTDL